MKLDLNLFDSMFPTYRDFRVPMWSDWKEKESELELQVAIPGYEKEAFKLFVNNDELTLNIEDRLHYSIVSNFWSKDYKLDKAKATYKNGVLKINIPKEENKVKQTEIEVF